MRAISQSGKTWLGFSWLRAEPVSTLYFWPNQPIHAFFYDILFFSE